MRTKPLRWRFLTGRRYDPKCYGLFRDGVQLATAQETKEPAKWFWYGQGHNTAGRPASLDAVKLEAANHVRGLGL